MKIRLVKSIFSEVTEEAQREKDQMNLTNIGFKTTPYFKLLKKEELVERVRKNKKKLKGKDC